MKDELINFLENIGKATKVMIESILDEDLNWKPNHTDRSVLELISHLATLSFVDIKGGFGELKSSKEFTEHQEGYAIKNTTDAVGVLNDSIKFAMETFRTIKDENMNDKKVQFFYQSAPESYASLLTEIIEHLSIHRGILFMYMKEMGYEATMGTYYGFQPAVKHK